VRALASAAALLVLAGLAGCATPAAREAAAAGGDQVSRLRAELARKVAAENQYYDGARALTHAALLRASQIRLQDELTVTSVAFAHQHSGTAAEELGGPIRELQTGAVDARRDALAKERDLERALESELDANRQKIALEDKKLAGVQSQLEGLARGKAWKDLLVFLAEYAKETRAAIKNSENPPAETSPVQ
jgi:hypothetical protein